MDASGKFGGALVFGKWKGRNTVRQLVTLSNPQSVGQRHRVNAMRTMAEVQRQMNLIAEKHAGDTLTGQGAVHRRGPPARHGMVFW